MLVARWGPDHTFVRPRGPRLEKLTRGHRWGYLHRGHRLRNGGVRSQQLTNLPSAPHEAAHRPESVWAVAAVLRPRYEGMSCARSTTHLFAVET